MDKQIEQKMSEFRGLVVGVGLLFAVAFGSALYGFNLGEEHGIDKCHAEQKK